MKNKNTYNFFAFINRQKLINRWSLMHNRHIESVSLHSYNTAIIAHALGSIDNVVFGLNTNADKCSSLALFHDATEVLTGDIPTPVKYHNGAMQAAYKEAEKDAIGQLLLYLPDIFKSNYKALLEPTQNTREYVIVKFADKLSALIKCIEEVASGNNDFKAAKKSTQLSIDKFTDPTVKYFVDNFVKAFELNLDELVENK